jgi:hypothetical protein
VARNARLIDFSNCDLLVLAGPAKRKPAIIVSRRQGKYRANTNQVSRPIYFTGPQIAYRYDF